VGFPLLGVKPSATQTVSLRLLVAFAKLLAMWAQHELMQLIRNKEVILWLVGAENALVGALSAIGAVISWSVARHAEQMPLWLDRLLPPPFAVCVIVGLREYAVSMGLSLGLANATRQPLLLAVAAGVSIATVLMHAQTAWNEHKNELGGKEIVDMACQVQNAAEVGVGVGKEKEENKAKTAKTQKLKESTHAKGKTDAFYDARLRMLLPSVSQKAEEALMATITKVRSKTQSAALNAVGGLCTGQLKTFAVQQVQSYVTGKLKSS